MSNPDETIPHEAAVKDVVDAEIDRVGGGGSDLSSLVTAKGALLVATGPGTLDQLGHGVDGSVLTSQSSQDSGLEWMLPDAPPTPPGMPVIRRFAFAHFTPDLLTGFEVYIPTIGELLLDGWLEIDTAWNGTTPKGDYGSFNAGMGWLAAANVPMSMTDIDNANEWNSDLLVENANHRVGAGADSGSLSMAFLASGHPVWGFRALPAKFITTDPIKIVVSQDGRNDGADPGSTQGAGALYLVTCIPLST